MRKILLQRDYQQIQDLGEGFIYNDFSPSGTQGDYNLLHRASCRWLERSNLSYDKYFFKTLNEAETWLENQRGEDWRR